MNTHSERLVRCIPKNSSLALALTAIVFWSFQGYLSMNLSQQSPFLYGGMALSIGGLISIHNVRQWRVPLMTLLVGVSGIFFYHLLFFMAFKAAPTVETNLLNYLWPLLLVLLSPLVLPGSRLKSYHIIGAVTGFIGAGLIVTGGHLSLNLDNLNGYLMISSAALIWALYSLMLKRLPPFPSSAMGGFCLISGLLMLGIYSITEYGHWTVGSMKLGDWFHTILLGVGPLGLSFIAWSASIKKGDPRVIGSISYLLPLTSTIVLIWLGGKHISFVTVIAMLLIIMGAAIGSLDLLSTGNQENRDDVIVTTEKQ